MGCSCSSSTETEGNSASGRCHRKHGGGSTNTTNTSFANIAAVEQREDDVPDTSQPLCVTTNPLTIDVDAQGEPHPTNHDVGGVNMAVMRRSSGTEPGSTSVSPTSATHRQSSFAVGSLSLQSGSTLNSFRLNPQLHKTTTSSGHNSGVYERDHQDSGVGSPPANGESMQHPLRSGSCAALDGSTCTPHNQDSVPWNSLYNGKRGSLDSQTPLISPISLLHQGRDHSRHHAYGSALCSPVAQVHILPHSASNTIAQRLVLSPAASSAGIPTREISFEKTPTFAAGTPSSAETNSPRHAQGCPEPVLLKDAQSDTDDSIVDNPSPLHVFVGGEDELNACQRTPNVGLEVSPMT